MIFTKAPIWHFLQWIVDTDLFFCCCQYVTFVCFQSPNFVSNFILFTRSRLDPLASGDLFVALQGFRTAFTALATIVVDSLGVTGAIPYSAPLADLDTFTVLQSSFTDGLELWLFRLANVTILNSPLLLPTLPVSASFNQPLGTCLIQPNFFECPVRAREHHARSLNLFFYIYFCIFIFFFIFTHC